MVLWFAGLSVAVVWLVFRDTAIDYRLVVVGALAPDVIDAALGGARPLHTLLGSAVLLVVVMFATRGRRGRRRRLLALPIGTFLHLVLDGVWARTTLFWWPLFGVRLPAEPLPSLSRPTVVLVLQEVGGLVALWWWWRRFALDEPDRRRAFLRTGRLGRDLARDV